MPRNTATPPGRFQSWADYHEHKRAGLLRAIALVERDIAAADPEVADRPAGLRAYLDTLRGKLADLDG